MTIDELATSGGTTVRTTRYYVTLGLLPTGEKRGRTTYYDQTHLARLELVRALQEHGFTLQAIEAFLADLPQDASVADLAVRRAMLTSWSPRPSEVLSPAGLEQRAGRALSAEDVTLLISLGALEIVGDAYRVTPTLEVNLALIELDIPRAGMQAAAAAMGRHMGALVDDLDVIMREQVLEPFSREARSAADAARMEETVARLRQLTLEAVVTGFQRAANAVIARSLS